MALFRSERAPLDLQILGRTLLHASLVGFGAGIIGAGFFVALEYTEKILLETLAGYKLLRAHGETFGESGGAAPHPFRPWLLVFIPGLGALMAGWATRFAPETRGGGGDAMIGAFHNHGGVIRRRVLWVKALASILTLGTGGSGGREGPTMQIGAALGSNVASLLRLTTRERRILMVAGVAAGMSAVFRTPLGAALLAVEALYRDDFESDALVPAILASVLAYSVVISLFGESTLFARAPSYPFHAAHLPLYGLLAVFVAMTAAVFVRTLHWVEHMSEKTSVPAWVRPGMGGLALGLFAVPVICLVGWRIGSPGQGLGLLGGGYGAAQLAITGSSLLPSGWSGVQMLLLLGAAKLVASSLTIGSGGSAGDFAPSLVLGGLFGGAFGRAAQLLLHDPSIDPGAFALVGMGTFYGGIAHVPISALVFVSELAGSYDLLVPLMLTTGIAFVTLRNRSLYRAQVKTKSDSPAHRLGLPPELKKVAVIDVMTSGRPHVTFELGTTAAEVTKHIGESTWQEAFPVLDPAGVMRGLISADALRFLVREGEIAHWTIAADLMQQPVSLRPEDDLRAATKLMLAHGLREVPVLDEGGHILGFLQETDAMQAYIDVTAVGEAAAPNGVPE
jgi:CIC family chloride channel protein